MTIMLNYNIRKYYPSKTKQQIAKEQEFICAGYSSEVYKCLNQNKDLQEIGFQIDHITPLQFGGSNDRSNLQALCIPCHIEKTRIENKKETKEIYNIKKQIERENQNKKQEEEITRRKEEIQNTIKTFIDKCITFDYNSCINENEIKIKFSMYLSSDDTYMAYKSNLLRYLWKLSDKRNEFEKEDIPKFYGLKLN
jgi:5-methylcytosine-specific restriction endonuclease McrA